MSMSTAIRPCPGGRHDFTTEYVHTHRELRCMKCPLVMSSTGLASRRDMAAAVTAAERDWYIKELES